MQVYYKYLLPLGLHGIVLSQKFVQNCTTSGPQTFAIHGQIHTHIYRQKNKVETYTADNIINDMDHNAGTDGHDVGNENPKLLLTSPYEFPTRVSGRNKPSAQIHTA